jgi:uncharacterized protein YlxP (DUF503 family)
MSVHVLALVMDLHLPQSHSLKDKRAVVKTILEGARRRYQVAAAETANQDQRQRAGATFGAVSSSHRHVTEVVDEVERFVWSFPEVEVLDAQRHWLEIER